MKRNPELVNLFFRQGIPRILCFDPWGIDQTVDLLDTVPMYNLFIEPIFREEVMKKYAKNWNRVINEYLTWQEEKYPDPVQQCYEISEKTEEIFDLLFEGIDVSKEHEDPQLFNLRFSTAKHIEQLTKEILPWALTHKFTGEVSEDEFESD